MTSTKIIAVIGATGFTAGGLARAILNDPEGGFSCRAITRNPDSDAARALAEQGATVVRADLDDPDSVVQAFSGAYGAFCMTGLWEPSHEAEQAANQARAAAAAGVRHVVWQTLEDARHWYPLDDDRMPTLMGRYKVPAFEGKADGDRYFAESGVPTTYLLTPTHWDAFVFGGGVPQPGPDGIRTIGVPVEGTLLPGIAAEDIGRCAYRVFADPDQYAGARIGLAAEHSTGEQLAAGLTRLFGEEIRYWPLPIEVFRSFPFPGADIAANMFQFIAEVPEYAASRDPAVARALEPSLLSFDDWVEVTRAKLASRTGVSA